MRRGSADAEAAPAPAGHDDPLQRLLDNPNPIWSAAELWRSTETSLLLWGSAFWSIERGSSGAVTELWPLRADRVKVLPDARRYIKGFVYESGGDRVAYLPEEIVWFRHFNPLEELSGLSSVAPARMAVEMGNAALRFNHGFFSNSAQPADVVVTTKEMPPEEEVKRFYDVWESRFKGAANSHRPLLLAGGMDAKRLGLSQRDMEFVKGLEWSVEEVSRAFGVPKVFLAEMEDATLANVETLERFLWRNTIVPELRLLQDAVTRSLARLFDEFPGQYSVAFDLGAIEALHENENDRVDRHVKLVQAGIMTVEEARVAEGLAVAE
jgi:HK97 family phage portal protein